MFEGYVGIRLWSGQLMEDVWFSILFVLFFLFAIHARIHVKSFIKIFRNLGFNTSGKAVIRTCRFITVNRCISI